MEDGFVRSWLPWRSQVGLEDALEEVFTDKDVMILEINVGELMLFIRFWR